MPESHECGLRASPRQQGAAPEPDLHAFAVELVDTMRAADSLGNSASVAQLLIAWQHTAEAYYDPEPLAALTKDHGEDYGPVPDPRDVA
ncbi:hypothetical protein [Streptomyces sp. NPDC048106]|uniref:hypothetical protein n=1 Tax=Streptomyces sp. NPDC048106 TaxID=3155750 RepID=UPI0034513448